MDRYQEVIDRTRCVKRMLIPVMADDPIPGRPRRHGLSPDDYGLVMEGRACPACLACWQDEVLLKCPLCGHERSPADFLSGVKEWQDYQTYVREQEENPQRTEVEPMHKIVERISRAHGVKPTYD